MIQFRKIIDRLNLVIGIGAAATLVLLVLLFMPPSHSRAKKNQLEVIGLLTQARPEFNSADHSRIQNVRLGERATLLAGETQTIAGYVLTVEVEGSAFTVAAIPKVLGTTGFLSFFRDQTGALRFEVGKPASAGSRLWSPAVPEPDR